ncbi:C6 finger domain protein [Aspergillus campestris IBT 28561]|uniref:C6 finger domain protein n=1 Tax=Aspergillus campestris (strain IBT 28561) TaxID=1392248 RepID=A0A2I1CYN3_ASPC2|nr:C6 finger domain protein [Aspergillus campestris IBT 28561]PKY02737.1 C6 finger domain protein [Aspergillus campestris IBT 28561]
MPPVKVACLSCRSRRIRCDGQEKCSNCVAKDRPCLYVPSNRGGPRNCQNRKRRKTGDTPPSPMSLSDIVVSSEDDGIQQLSGLDAALTGWGSDEDDLYSQLVSMSEPGAGLRSVDSSIEEVGQIFDCIFSADETHAPAEPEQSVSDMVQVYGSNEDIIDAYYVFIHIYYPILPPPERLPVTNRPLNVKSPFQPTSPLSLAMAALLVLIPRPDVKQASEAEYTKLRRDLAQSFAQSALDAVEQDLELLDSSSDPSKALSEGAPQLTRPPLHSKLPVSLEAVLALVLLSTYEYAQRGNIRKLCNRAGQALTAAMSVSLHEMVEEDEFSEARKRAWWMTYITVCQGSIVSGVPAAINVYDPRFVTPYPKGWKLLIEAQQTILEATTFVHDLNETAKSRFQASWIPSRMTQLDAQITQLLLMCRECTSLTPNTLVPITDSPDQLALQSIRHIAEIKLHSSRIKIHRFCAFSDIPIFRRRHCDLDSTASPSPQCCGLATPTTSTEHASASSPGSASLASSSTAAAATPPPPPLGFPFSSHESSKMCLQAALNIVRLLDNLPYPNPDSTVPLTSPPYMSASSRVEIPRTMPTFACCIMQASYAMLMVYMKARPMHSNGADALDSSKGRAWIGLVNELQQNLRVVSKTLANYAIASEALRGMKDEVSHWVFLDG